MGGKGYKYREGSSRYSFSNNDVYKFGFYLQKFIILTKIPETSHTELLCTSRELLAMDALCTCWYAVKSTLGYPLS